MAIRVSGVFVRINDEGERYLAIELDGVGNTEYIGWLVIPGVDDAAVRRTATELAEQLRSVVVEETPADLLTGRVAELEEKVSKHAQMLTAVSEVLVRIRESI